MSVVPEVPFYVRYARDFNEKLEGADPPVGLSYDDIILLPGPSIVDSTEQVSLATELVKGVPLWMPIVSANMDSVTEAPMAEMMARLGGIGILHRAMTIKEMVGQVTAVKDALKVVVEDPPIVDKFATVGQVRGIMGERRRGFVLIAEDGKLIGIVSTRDVPEDLSSDLLVTDETPWGGPIMTPRDQLIVAEPWISIEEALVKMYRGRVEKLPLVNPDGEIKGVITERDLRTLRRYPHATKDEKGRLRVGVAIGQDPDDYPDRIAAAAGAGADILCVDVLHGDTRQVKEVIQYIIKNFPRVPVIAGNVGTPEETRDLIQSGAGAVKVGYGDGSLCSTQIVTGTGAKQFTAVARCAAEVSGTDVRIIADGGVRSGGDVIKALYAGGDTVMVGTGLAGYDESPGSIVVNDETGERFKEIRGMATEDAASDLARVKGKTAKPRAPQGIRARVVYGGKAEPVVIAWMDGGRHGIANVGGIDILSLRQRGKITRQTPAGVQEGRPHVLFSGRRR